MNVQSICCVTVFLLCCAGGYTHAADEMYDVEMGRMEPNVRRARDSYQSGHLAPTSSPEHPPNEELQKRALHEILADHPEVRHVSDAIVTRALDNLPYTTRARVIDVAKAIRSAPGPSARVGASTTRNPAAAAAAAELAPALLSILLGEQGRENDWLKQDVAKEKQRTAQIGGQRKWLGGGGSLGGIIIGGLGTALILWQAGVNFDCNC